MDVESNHITSTFIGIEHLYEVSNYGKFSLFLITYGPVT